MSNEKSGKNRTIDAMATLKMQAADKAVEWVESGMVLGLGSGSTAAFATQRIGQMLRDGALCDVVAIPTSDETEALARREGISLVSLDDRSRVDLTIDGADEVDGALNVIKGLGGYLLREKIVARATDHELIIVDDRKLVERLGTRSPVPVEVVQFGWKQSQSMLCETGARPVRRLRDDRPYVTDEGNYILDCHYDGGIDDPQETAVAIKQIPGVVEHGLFLAMVQTVVVASFEGIEVREQ